jgi:hypothetical protein
MDENADILKIHHVLLSKMTENETFFYLLDTSEIVDEYKHMLETPITISFFDTAAPPQISCTTSQKQQLFAQYLQIVNDLVTKYKIQVETVPTTHTESTDSCVSCDQSELTESIDFEGIMICTNCGFQDNTRKLLSSMKISHSDSERINICSKYTYEKRSHFINCIDQFQGKTKTEIEPAALRLLHDEMTKYRLTPSTLTKEHVLLFIKDLKLSKYYGDINIIYHKLTGKELHDISHLIDHLKDDFDTFVKVYYKLYPQETERRNFNYQQLLFQLLSRHKYPCASSDFNFLKTIERKTYHEDICKQIFEILGWNYTFIS